MNDTTQNNDAPETQQIEQVFDLQTLMGGGDATKKLVNASVNRAYSASVVLTKLTDNSFAVYKEESTSAEAMFADLQINEYNEALGLLAALGFENVRGIIAKFTSETAAFVNAVLIDRNRILQADTSIGELLQEIADEDKAELEAQQKAA